MVSFQGPKVTDQGTTAATDRRCCLCPQTLCPIITKPMMTKLASEQRRGHYPIVANGAITQPDCQKPFFQILQI